MKVRNLSPVILLAILGCSEKANGPRGAEQKTATTGKKTAEEARVYVQAYIDRFLGGQSSLKGPLLGIGGVKYGTVESVEIVRAVPKYSPDGQLVDGMFLVVIKARGVEGISGRKSEHEEEHLVMFKDGKWMSTLESP